MSKVSCCVVGCHNTYKNTQPRNVSFYCFPSECVPHRRERRIQWINAVKRKNLDGTPWQPNKNTRICSDHFVQGDKSDNPQNLAYVPTIFPKIYKLKVAENNLERLKRLKMRNVEEIPGTEMQQDAHTSSIIDAENSVEEMGRNASKLDAEIQVNLVDYSSKCIEHFFCNRFVENCTSSAEKQAYIKTHVNQEVSCDILYQERRETKEVGCGMEPFLRGDPILCQGFHGYSSVKDSKELKDISGVSQGVFTQLLNILPDTCVGNAKISKENKLLICLMKLKLGITYAALAVLFGVHRTTASRSFSTYLETLAYALQSCIFWPSKSVIQDTLPPTFQEKYPDCRAIIDCTEIRIETPTTNEQRVLCYSHYKGGCTFKFLVACSPNGFICFKSKCYGGRSSDSYITNDCEFLDLISPGDVILADKGFPSIKCNFCYASIFEKPSTVS